MDCSTHVQFVEERNLELGVIKDILFVNVVIESFVILVQQRKLVLNAGSVLIVSIHFVPFVIIVQTAMNLMKLINVHIVMRSIVMIVQASVINVIQKHVVIV